MKRVGFVALILVCAVVVAYLAAPWVASLMVHNGLDLTQQVPLLVALIIAFPVALAACLIVNAYLTRQSQMRMAQAMQNAWHKQEESLVLSSAEYQDFYQQAWHSLAASQGQVVALKQKLKQTENHYQAEQQSQQFLLQERTQEAATSQQEVQILQNRLVKMQHYRHQMNKLEQEISHFRHQLAQHIYLPMQSWTTKLDQIQQECHSPLLATQLRLLSAELEDAQSLTYMLGFLPQHEQSRLNLPKQQVELAYLCYKTIAMSGREVSLCLPDTASLSVKIKAPILHQVLLMLIKSFPNKAANSAIDMSVSLNESRLVFRLVMPDFVTLAGSKGYQQQSYKPQSPQIKQAQQLISQLPGKLKYQQLDDAIVRCEFDCDGIQQQELQSGVIKQQQSQHLMQQMGLNKVVLISEQTCAEYAPQFAGLGIELFCVTSVDQALTLLAQHAIKVLLLQEGDTVASAIKQLVDGFTAVEADPTPSIVLLSQTLNQRQMLAYLQLGCDDFMTLPLQQKEVLRVFDRIVQQPASEDSWQLFHLLLQSQLNHRSAAELVALGGSAARLSKAQAKQLETCCLKVYQGDNLPASAVELAGLSQTLGLTMMATLAKEISQQVQPESNLAGLQVLLWQAYEETLSLLDTQLSTTEK